VVGVKANAILIFIFEEEVVVELFGPIGFEEPRAVVALPGDVKGGAIPDDGVAGEVGHVPC